MVSELPPESHDFIVQRAPRPSGTGQGRYGRPPPQAPKLCEEAAASAGPLESGVRSPRECVIFPVTCLP